MAEAQTVSDVLAAVVDEPSPPPASPDPAPKEAPAPKEDQPKEDETPKEDPPEDKDDEVEIETADDKEKKKKPKKKAKKEPDPDVEEDEDEDEDDFEDDEDTEETVTKKKKAKSNLRDLPQKLKFKTKIDGVEEEVILDEQEIRRDYQKWKAAEKRFHESSMQRKKVDEVMGLLQKPETLAEALEKLGYDVKQLAEQYLYEQIQFAQMPPEMQELYTARKQLAKFQEEERQRKIHEENLAEEQREREMASKLQDEVIEALQDSNLPQTPEMVRRIARHKRIYLDRGVDIDAREAAQIVEDELIAENQAILSKMDGDKLERILGQDISKNLRMKDIEKIKNPIPDTPKPKEKVIRPKKSRGYVSEGDFENYMEKIKRSK